jgi:hypothetical protein
MILDNTQNTYLNNNSFSMNLNNLIKGIYSEENETAKNCFLDLIEYFTNGHATKSELHCLIMTNQNPIVYLMSRLNANSKSLLSQAVGKAIKDELEERNNYESDFDSSGNEYESDDIESLGKCEDFSE